MRWLRGELVAVLAWLLFFSGTARAAPIYSYVFDQPSYVVPAGGTVDVQVFLQETLTAPLDRSLLATEGLFSAGVRIRFDLPPVPPKPSQVVSLADIVANPAFDDPFGSLRVLVPGSSAGLAENVTLLSPAGVLATGGPSVFQLLLGTFRFTAGDMDEVTVLQATDLSPLNETVTFRTATVLDGQINVGQATIRVVIPEPAGLVLFVTGTLGLMVWQWRRGRALPQPPQRPAMGRWWPHRRNCTALHGRLLLVQLN